MYWHELWYIYLCQKIISYFLNLHLLSDLGAIYVMWMYQKAKCTKKCTQPIFRNYPFKRARRTSVTLWHHSCTATGLSITSSTAVAAKTQPELMQKWFGWCLLRLVRADQLQQTELFKRESLKGQVHRVNRGAAATDSMRKMFIWTQKGAHFFEKVTKIKVRTGKNKNNMGPSNHFGHWRCLYRLSLFFLSWVSSSGVSSFFLSTFKWALQ